MNYIELHCRVFPVDPASDILMAQLAEIGFEGFAESDTGLLAYIPSDLFDITVVKQLPIVTGGLFDISFEHHEIEEENWNSLWESYYEPVLIDNLCFVRAPFHKSRQDVQHEIVVEPKMSFGTAHHETTELTIRLMYEVDFKQRTVLDMGTGTGILAILASKMGADHITAIDVDDWAYDNAPQNFSHNGVNNVSLLQGDAGAIPDKTFDVIIANINRNVLLEDMDAYARHLNKNGAILLSGFYEHDIPVITQSAKKSGLSLESRNRKNDWVALKAVKS